MPNYVKNRLTITGDVKAVLDFVKSEKSLFDFNKIIPMPEILSKITLGGKMIDGESVTRWIDDVDSEGKYNSRKLTKEEEKEARKTGFETWYDWAIANWNTKWNACEPRIKADNCIEFETAWSNVEVILSKLSLKFPETSFYYEYADEDTGRNTGCGTIEKGIASMRDIEDGSKEAYDIAFKLNPEDAQYYVLIDGRYSYKDEED